MAFSQVHLWTEFIGRQLQEKRISTLLFCFCVAYESKLNLLRTGELLRTRAHISIFQHTASNIKALFSERPRSTTAHPWEAGKVGQSRRTRWHCAPCSLWQTPPAREITMSDHVGHQEPADGTNLSPVACVGCNLSPAPPWAWGRFLFPECASVFRAWVPTNVWSFTAIPSLEILAPWA